MKATETDIQQLIEGDKQFLVPLFQRTYTWTEDEWEVMWADLVDLYDAEETPGHFIGSIVTIQLPAQPHEIKKISPY